MSGYNYANRFAASSEATDAMVNSLFAADKARMDLGVSGAAGRAQLEAQKLRNAAAVKAQKKYGVSTPVRNWDSIANAGGALAGALFGQGRTAATGSNPLSQRWSSIADMGFKIPGNLLG